MPGRICPAKISGDAVAMRDACQFPLRASGDAENIFAGKNF